MQLSLHADYALRVLVFVGSHPERVVSTQEISDAYGISKHHLVRVVQTLAANEYVKIRAGRSGGIVLGRDPSTIRLGDVVKDAEPNLRLVECFDRQTNTCILAPVCTLKALLRDALYAFLNELNRHTLADLLKDGGREKMASVFATFAGFTA